MERKCANCVGIDFDKKYKNMWGETMYYCEREHKDVRMGFDACPKFKAVEKDKGDYTPSGCYITTILCDILGYDDDCQLLVSLRDFRDNYLKKHPEYLNMLLEYDFIGPLISRRIIEEDNNALFAQGLVEHFIIPCVEAIIYEDYDKAIRIYSNMVIYLNDEFDLPMVKFDNNVKYDMETLGKGRVRVLTSE